METKFIMMVGLPGSGKSTLAKDIAEYEDAVILSSDEIREELNGDVNCQSNPGRIFEEMNKRTIANLKAGKTVIYDATNISARLRKSTVTNIKRACGTDITYNCVIVLCSITCCKQRQSLRDRVVPDSVIYRMAQNFQVPYFNEGWDNIYLSRNGSEQDIEREHARSVETSHDNPHHKHSIGYHCTRALIEMRALIEGTEYEEEHISKVLEEAAYQHDIGKRKTKVFTDRDGNPTDIAHFYQHDNVGAYLWLSGNEHDKWDESDFLLIALLIQWHMIPYIVPGRNKAAVDKWAAKRGFDSNIADYIWLIHQADRAAHQKGKIT